MEPGTSRAPLPSNSQSSIHSDSIGEYKSEYIKVSFDAESFQVKHNKDRFTVCKDIKKIDLNEHGYKTHILREGKYMEKLFFGVRLINFKKVLTIRSQFQLVNLTGFDYLVHFRFKDSSLLKFLESGDSLPLAMRLDESRIQIKMIDPTSTEKSNFSFLSQISKSKLKCARTGRERCPEELHAMQADIPDFRDPRLQYQNWTAFVPLFVLKERLKFDDCSFLTNSQSRFTFIKKTKTDKLQQWEEKQQMVDINMMPPMIVKNCLPFNMELQFVDSSQVRQKQTFQKN